MNGEFGEDTEVVLYKSEIYKIDKMMTIEELQNRYKINKCNGKKSMYNEACVMRHA